jgi:hypothetical protein
LFHIWPLVNSKTVYDDKQNNRYYVSQDTRIPATSQQKTTSIKQPSHLKHSTSIPDELDLLPDSQQDMHNIDSMENFDNCSPNDKNTHSAASILHDNFTVITKATQDSLKNCTGIQSGQIEHQQTPLLYGQDKTGPLENNVFFYRNSDVLLYENVVDKQLSLLDNRCIISKDVSDFGNHCNTPTENFTITGIADSSDCAVLGLSAYVGYMMTTVASGPQVENGNNNKNENPIKMSSDHKNEEIIQFENMPQSLNLSVESIHDVTAEEKSSTWDKPENSDLTQELPVIDCNSEISVLIYFVKPE